MITTIINALFSISLFVTGGNIVSTNLKLHHYSDDDYKDIEINRFTLFSFI